MITMLGSPRLSCDGLTRRETLKVGALSLLGGLFNLPSLLALEQARGPRARGGKAKSVLLLYLQGGPATQDMFDKNILTFNPGWDQNAQKLATFTDVRELQRQLKAQGVQMVNEADESTTGPASFIAVDPDGNPILVDQHV